MPPAGNIVYYRHIIVFYIYWYTIDLIDLYYSCCYFHSNFFPNVFGWLLVLSMLLVLVLTSITTSCDFPLDFPGHTK